MNLIRSSVVLLLFVSVGNGANILGIFIHPGYSHFRFFNPVLIELSKQGHDVTVVSHFKSPVKLKNYHEILLSGEHLKDSFEIAGRNPSRSLPELYREFWFLAEEGERACNSFYRSNVVQRIRSLHAAKHFDLVILEYFNTDCLLGLVHVLAAPFVGIASCALMPWHYDRVGAPDFPSFIQTEFVGYSENLSFWERLENFIVTKGLKLLYRFVELKDNNIIREHLDVDVDVAELAKLNRLVLLNQHHSIHGARPLPRNVIEIGGAHIGTADEELPEELQHFLDNAIEGVMLISWGSLLKGSTLPESKVNAIIKTLDKFPQKVIWKWENTEAPRNDGKFLFRKWIPQKQILCHPNVVSFWSHGGLLGLSEGVYCGKPMLVTPFYGDQFLNGKAIENRGAGVVLHFEDFTEESIYSRIVDILSENVTRRAKQLSKNFRHRENSPMQTAVWWIENILDNQDLDLLYSPNVNMNWFVYHSWDAILFLVITSSTSVVLFVSLVKCLFHVMCTTQGRTGIMGAARKPKTA